MSMCVARLGIETITGRGCGLENAGFVTKTPPTAALQSRGLVVHA
jgi:hypothetical protein